MYIATLEHRSAEALQACDPGFCQSLGSFASLEDARDAVESEWTRHGVGEPDSIEPLEDDGEGLYWYREETDGSFWEAVIEREPLD